MAQLTTANYFTGDITIPGYSGSASANLAVQNLVSQAIFDNEDRFLKKLLGEDTYDAFIAGLAVASPEAKWTALRDQIFKETVISSTVTRYESPCARYIFINYYREHLTSSTPLGEVQANADNGTPVSATNRICSVWNKMVDRIVEIWEWMEDDVRSADYPDFARPARTFDKINSFGI